MCVTCGGLCVPCRGVWQPRVSGYFTSRTSLPERLGNAHFPKLWAAHGLWGRAGALLCPEPADVTGVHWTPKVPAFHQPGIGFPAPFSSPKPLLSFGSCEKWRLQGRAKAPVVRRALGAPAVGAGLGMCLWQGW